MKEETAAAGQSGGGEPTSPTSPTSPTGPTGPASSTEPASPAPGTRRPGGRTARTRAAVRDAVLSGLADHGYPGLTVEYVADHSGVHKTTLYRRWGG
uniref:TetR/AcrR family transcriptional regulator n=1 Tax=Streptomyces atriruber TaxID=545121 RepID=UPI000B1D4F1A